MVSLASNRFQSVVNDNVSTVRRLHRVHRRRRRRERRTRDAFLEDAHRTTQRFSHTSRDAPYHAHASHSGRVLRVIVKVIVGVIALSLGRDATDHRCRHDDARASVARAARRAATTGARTFVHINKIVRALG